MVYIGFHTCQGGAGFFSINSGAIVIYNIPNHQSKSLLGLAVFPFLRAREGKNHGDGFAWVLAPAFFHRKMAGDTAWYTSAPTKTWHWNDVLSWTPQKIEMHFGNYYLLAKSSVFLQKLVIIEKLQPPFSKREICTPTSRLQNDFVQASKGQVFTLLPAPFCRNTKLVKQKYCIYQNKRVNQE